jgi:hypothetical protein
MTMTSRYEYVWSETTRLYNEMIQTDDWAVNFKKRKSKSATFHIPVVQEVTTRIALSIILSVAFGLQLSWNDTSPSPAKSQAQANSKETGAGQMRLSDGVRVQADNVVIVAEAPFLIYLPIER